MVEFRKVRRRDEPGAQMRDVDAVALGDGDRAAIRRMAEMPVASAGGIDPDITVPQLSDPDFKDRKVVREADLRRHLLGQAKVDDKLLEEDDFSKDPRFNFTAAELEKKGVKDFQLDYALRTLKRLGTRGTNVASASTPKKS